MDLEPGQVCRGVISGVDDFCLTVTLEGGVHGRVSAANLSWKRVDHPSQVASVGEEVTVVFMSFDPDRNDISLSIKDLTVDPFIEFARTQLGETCLGRVAKITPIGFFVRLLRESKAFCQVLVRSMSGSGTLKSVMKLQSGLTT